MYFTAILENTGPSISLSSDNEYLSSSPSNEEGPTRTCTQKEAAVPLSAKVTKRKRIKKIIPPNNCLKCKKEIKGMCPTCLLKEMKNAIKEKDKQLQLAHRHIDKLEKKLATSDKKNKDRVKTYRTRINTWEKRYARIRKYSAVKFTDFSFSFGY